MKTAFASLTTAALLTGLSAQGAPLIYESFSQDTSGGTSLNGKTAGTGLSGSWTDDQTVDIINPTTLSYGDLQNAGGEVQVTVGSGTDAFVSTSSVLGDNNLLDDGATVWFSFMLGTDGNTGGGTNSKGGFAFSTDNLAAAFNGTNMTNSGNGLGLQILADNVGAATWNGGGNFNSTGSTIAAGQNSSLFLVGKIEWGATAGDDETITIYNPSTSDLNTLGSAISTATMSGVDQTAFDTISMTHRNSDEGVVRYDEIRFGATYEDVSPVPEPGSLALLGLGGLLIARRRRG